MPYATWTKDAEKQAGLFTLWRKDGRVYLELKDDQFDKEYLQTANPVNGLGGYFVFSGNFFQMDARIVKFVRDGKRVAILWPHTRFLADANTPLAEAVRTATADSVEGMAAIVTEDKPNHLTVLDVSALLGDVADMTDTLNQTIADPRDPLSSYRLDPTRTFFGTSKAFPKNVLIEANQTYTSVKPKVITNVVDARSLLMRIKYNFTEVPSSDYMPRLTDDRVGFWTDPHIQFGHDSQADNRLQYVLRWNLKPSDPSTPLSPAVKPIMWTLSNTIPSEYRQPIREAVLEWNKAFEKVGIKDAMQVQDQPTDPSYDPEDVRYNTIRWLTESTGTGFAAAQILWNPRTGEIFRGGVVIDSDLMRFGKRFYDVFAASRGSEHEGENAGGEAAQRALHRHSEAEYAAGMREQMQFGALAMEMVNGWNSVPDWYGKQFLKAIVLHEIGHDFGLGHNFIGHNAYTVEQIHDKSFTQKYGLASSVMEYTPVNLPANGKKTGGEFNQTVLGPYDYHAIHWGYAQIPGAKTPQAEVPTLNKWASVATDPKLTFASDEDVSWASGHAIDPRVEQFMLSNDPITWCDDRMTLIHGLMQKIDTRYPRAQMPYEDERAVFSTMLGQYERCAVAASHYVGGEYLSRARRGDPHAGDPLTPVPLALEKRAYKVLSDHLLADAAWNFSPATLRRLVYTEYAPFADFGYFPSPRHDLSVAGLASAYQSRALGTMFAPLTLARLADLPTKAQPGQTMTLADLFTWTQDSVYGDVGRAKATTQVHRNLQRNYAHILSTLAVAPARGVPYDAQAMARHELANLSVALGQALRGRGLDVQTRAHYEALQVEVNRALEAKYVLPAA